MQIFFWSGTKSLWLSQCVNKFLVRHKKFGPTQNILRHVKGQGRWFAVSNIGFCAGTKVFEEALNAVEFLSWLKKFGPAQNILGTVKGRGFYFYIFYIIKRFIIFQIPLCNLQCRSFSIFVSQIWNSFQSKRIKIRPDKILSFFKDIKFKIWKFFEGIFF